MSANQPRPTGARPDSATTMLNGEKEPAMHDEIIPIEQNCDGSVAVNARDLHHGLGVTTRFNDWMPRMLAYGFEEGEDYVRLNVSAGHADYSNLSSRATEYVLTLDAAKEIAMLQRTERGQQVRRYFIEAEKRFRMAHRPAQLTEEQIVQQALQITVRKVKELEAVNAELTPKANAWDQMVSSAGSWSFEESAKVLFQHGVVHIGQNTLVKKLIEWKHLYRDAKGRPHAYQRSIEKGFFVTKARTYTDPRTGERRESSAPQVRITGKGLDMLFKRFQEGHLPGLPQIEMPGEIQDTAA